MFTSLLCFPFFFCLFVFVCSVDCVEIFKGCRGILFYRLPSASSSAQMMTSRKKLPQNKPPCLIYWHFCLSATNNYFSCFCPCNRDCRCPKALESVLPPRIIPPNLARPHSGWPSLCLIFITPTFFLFHDNLCEDWTRCLCRKVWCRWQWHGWRKVREK